MASKETKVEIIPANLFEDKGFTEDHSKLIREKELTDKKLPALVRKRTVSFPAHLAHSNLFMLSTRGRKWLLDDFPIISRWIPSGYELTYSGAGLDGLDLDVMLTVIKLMETRSSIDPRYAEDYVDKVLEGDKEYKNTPPIEKEAYKRRKILELSLAEGVFLEMAEFYDISGISKGGQTIEMVKDSLSRLSRGTITVKTNLKEKGKDNFEMSERLLYFVYLPEKGAFYITLSPMMFDMFRLKTSIINTHVYREMSKVFEGGGKAIDTNLYTLLMSFKRNDIWSVNITELLNKSPYYLMKQRHYGEIKSGSIAYALPDGKIDEKGLTLRQLDKCIARNRKDIIEFFQRLDELEIIKSQVEGRGDDIVISFRIPKELEKIAVQKINWENEQLCLNLLEEASVDESESVNKKKLARKKR